MEGRGMVERVRGGGRVREYGKGRMAEEEVRTEGRRGEEQQAQETDKELGDRGRISTSLGVATSAFSASDMSELLADRSLLFR